MMLSLAFEGDSSERSGKGFGIGFFMVHVSPRRCFSHIIVDAVKMSTQNSHTKNECCAQRLE